jgi:hypothetical protein
MSVGGHLGGVVITKGTVQPNIIGGKVFTPAAAYPSGSSPGKSYTVCEVSDGTTSCDCMGWTRRNPPGGRTCKHTQDYESFLRAQWGRSKSEKPVTIPSFETSTKASEKGGSLASLFAKLEKQEEAKP